VKTANENVITSTLKVEYKEVFKGFANLVELQTAILNALYLYKGDAAGLIRPDKYVIPFRRDNGKVLPRNQQVESILPITDEQREYISEVVQYMEGSKQHRYADLIARARNKPDNDIDDDIDDDDVIIPRKKNKTDKDTNYEKTSIRLLVGMNMLRAISLSPYLYQFQRLPKINYKKFVETSNKLLYVVECIRSVKKYHEANGQPVSGQIIYMNRAVEYFPLIKEYLVKEVGYQPHEVDIITGSMPANRDKQFVQNLFLGRRFDEATRDFYDIPDSQRVKVLIGSATIKEGMNLQTHSTVLYNCQMDWNPTDFMQLTGRIWRQGNLFRAVRIVNPLCEDSMDMFMFEKLEQKTSRINDLWRYTGENALNTEELDPQELKYILLKDVRVIAKLEADEKIAELKDEYVQIIVNEKIYKEILSELQWLRNQAYSLLGYIYSKKQKEIDNQSISYVEKNDLKNVLKAQFDGYNERLNTDSTFDFVWEWHNEFKKERAEKDAAHEAKSWRQKQYDNVNFSYRDGVNHIVNSFLSAKRKIGSLYRNNLKPLGISLQKEAIEAKIEEFIPEKERLLAVAKVLQSAENIARRAEEIEEERAANEYESATLTNRVKEFEKLNYLLSDKMVKPPKIKPIPETDDSITDEEEKARKIKIAQAKVQVQLRLIKLLNINFI
jgi:hypothetical protein